MKVSWLIYHHLWALQMKNQMTRYQELKRKLEDRLVSVSQKLCWCDEYKWKLLALEKIMFQLQSMYFACHYSQSCKPSWLVDKIILKCSCFNNNLICARETKSWHVKKCCGKILISHGHQGLTNLEEIHASESPRSFNIPLSSPWRHGIMGIFPSLTALPFPKEKYFSFSLVVSIPQEQGKWDSLFHMGFFFLVIWPAHTPRWPSLCSSFPGMHLPLCSAQNQTL